VTNRKTPTKARKTVKTVVTIVDMTEMTNPAMKARAVINAEKKANPINLMVPIGTP